MKKATFLLTAIAFIVMTSCTQTSDPVQSETTQTETPQLDYFQLKIFSFESAEQEASLDTYFQDALLPALHRSGINNVGVFKPSGLRK